jgi:hypothetical protein
VSATPGNISAIRACITQLVTADSLNQAFLLVVGVTFLTLLVAAFLGQDPAVRAARRASEPAAEPVAVEA